MGVGSSNHAYWLLIWSREKKLRITFTRLPVFCNQTYDLFLRLKLNITNLRNRRYQWFLTFEIEYTGAFLCFENEITSNTEETNVGTSDVFLYLEWYLMLYHRALQFQLSIYSSQYLSLVEISSFERVRNTPFKNICTV